MTYITYAKIGAGVFLAALLACGGWYFRGLKADAVLSADHAAMAKATADALIAQRNDADAQAKTDSTAEAAHDKTIEALPARVVHTPVWLRAPGELCADPVPGAQGKAAGVDPASRPTVPGPRGVDIRPGIEAFKLKYETALADCRRLDAEWPK